MYEINKNIFNKHKPPPTKSLIEIAMLTSGEDTNASGRDTRVLSNGSQILPGV